MFLKANKEKTKKTVYFAAEDVGPGPKPNGIALARFADELPPEEAALGPSNISRC